ncbi:TetR/AcrR family transcriptional regulator [Deinococcus sp. MIMF12]|uniref:TetR/AcrR family transcriptional regulator n=1 Tax=Deinococcus rhizophilus TaxID=3049544 RepID=A0ABT7JI22_9DEIO|nr:TetR/AcrR family transcriptional regulator [Deinococcus rhizophilus]MDL2344716.1 TetR/AcrR family transcriptional regulator [Deinococcus rhizophilus]
MTASSTRLPPPAPDTTRARILTEAARLFVASGYHGVSMREVAAAVGVTKPALYHHYADKEALFLAMLDGTLTGLARLVAHAETQAGVRAQLGTLVGDLLASAPEQRVGLQLAGELRHVSPERRAAFENEYRRVWMGGLNRLIEGAAARGELRGDLPAGILTRALLALLYPLVTGAPPSDPAGTARGLLTIYLDGAAQPPGAGNRPEHEGPSSDI